MLWVTVSDSDAIRAPSARAPRSMALAIPARLGASSLWRSEPQNDFESETILIMDSLQSTNSAPKLLIYDEAWIFVVVRPAGLRRTGLQGGSPTELQRRVVGGGGYGRIEPAGGGNRTEA